MDLLAAIEARHSVRSYKDEMITQEALAEIRAAIAQCNSQSGLNIQVCVNEPNAFQGIMARYGKFQNVKNYIGLVGPKGPGLEEKCGYYGEKIVLRLTQLGLNSCWVAASYSKSKTAVTVNPGEKLLSVIAFGYGVTEGVKHNSKTIEQLSKVQGTMPEWFRQGVVAASLAPTALNQQKFCFELVGEDRVKATAGRGFYTKTDLGIAKYHFETGAEGGNWQWV